MLANIVFLFLSCTGFYITFSQSWSALYSANLLLHPVLGCAGIFILFAYIRRHIDEKSCARKELKKGIFFFARASGMLTAAFFAFLALSGIVLIPGADHKTKLILLHRYAAYGAVALYALHGIRFAALRVFFPRRTQAQYKNNFIVPVLCFLTLAAFTGIYHGKEKGASASLALLELLEKKPDKNLPSDSLSLSQSCGSDAACHNNHVKEYTHTAHFLSPQTPHFKKIIRLLEKERGKQATRFCAACHSPSTALSKNIHPSNMSGISCAACHSINRSFLKDDRVRGNHEHEKEGYEIFLNTAHLSMLMPVDKHGHISPLVKYLIKLNPLGHGRVFMRAITKTDELCLSCHQEHIPFKKDETFIRPRCADCHMTNQKALTKSKVKMPHVFAGANNVLPYLNHDKKMLSIIRRWAEGNLPLQSTDSFWELRYKSSQKPSSAFWLIMAFEVKTPPQPGRKCALRVFTSNAGIGHPFPTGVLDLYDVWLEFVVKDKHGNVLFKSGKPGGIFYKEDSTHRLGGYFYDKIHRTITRHRIWEKKGVVKRWIDPGATVTDDFTFSVPQKTKGPLMVEAAWHYDRMNAPFKKWAYAHDETFNPPPLKMAALKKEIPFKKND